MGCGTSKGGTQVQIANGEDGTAEEEFTSPLTEEQIQERVVAIDKSRAFVMKSIPLTVRYAYVSQRGYYPDELNKSNQDAFCIAENVCGEEESVFFGVFDGHGSTGDKCSAFVRDTVLETLERKTREYKDDFEMAYKQTFIDINERLHANVRARMPDLPCVLERGVRSRAAAPVHPRHLYRFAPLRRERLTTR